MAAYDSLKSLVQQAIRTNGNNEITGQVLQNVLMAMIDELGGENGYAGVATPSTNPGAPDGKVFYFATEAGTYTHFDGATLAKGIHLLVFNGVTWSHQTLYTIDSEVTSGSNNLITSGAVYTKIINAINALDATVSKSAGADGLSLSLTETDGKVTNISGSIAPQTYDAYGAASAAQSAASADATNKVNAAKTQILGDAASDYNTLGKLEDKIQAEASRAAAAENALNTDKADKATTLAGYGINDAYTKTEVNGLVSTPHQNYVTVPTYASLPETGSADTIYRVSNYNGSTSQVDASVYSEYAWNGSGYTFLRVVSQVGEVFDITVYNSNTKYADLASALGTNGANVPSSIRRGGMSVKFVQSSDNKYVQYRYMLSSITNSNFTNVWNWVRVEDEIDALYNCLSRNVKQKTSIIKTNNSIISRYNTVGIRANKFEGCFIGIRVHVALGGQLEYGIIEGNSYTILDTVYVHAGVNDIFFSSLQHCNANRHIYIKPDSCIVKATSNGGVGMYECLNGNTTFYSGWEVFYDAIESIGIEELRAIRGPQAVLSECNYTSGNQYARANANTNNMNVKAIMVYANFDGVLDYGIMDASDNNSIEKIGEIQLTKGWNYKVLENVVKTEDYTFLYVQPNSGNAQDRLLNMFINNAGTFTKAVGLYETSDVPYSGNAELVYYCIDERNQDNLLRYFLVINDKFEDIDEEIDYCKLRIAENVPNLVSQYVSPTTALSDISQYHNSSILRCNKLRADVVKGIRFYFNQFSVNGTIEICKVNVSSNSIQLITSFNVDHLGVSDFFFDIPVSLGSNEYIGVRGSGSPSMGTHSEEGSVGMYELDYNDTFTFYSTFEIAYALITDIGCNVAKDIFDLKEAVFSDFVDVNYGEILLPSEIEVARSRQCNLWWDCIANYLIGDKSVYFETHCSIGHNLERGYRIEGSEQAIGNYTLRIVSRKSKTREVIDDKTVTIHVVNDSAGSSSKQILMIGDSRTWQNISTEQGVSYNFANMGDKKTITAEVKRLVDANEGATFTFLGTFVSPVDSTVKNLAQSGGTYSWANTQIGQSIVDYIENQCGGTGLDYVTIMYGINDIEDWNNNQIGQYGRSVAKITSVLNDAKALVDKILAGYPNCKIIMVVEPTTCGNQDGFGTWGQTDKDQHLEIEFAQKYLRKKFLEVFDSHEYGNNVYVSSAGIWCDRLYGFPYTKQHPSSRASEKIVEYFRNSVHPHDDGYKQIADGIYSTIKYLES